MSRSSNRAGTSKKNSDRRTRTSYGGGERLKENEITAKQRSVKKKPKNAHLFAKQSSIVLEKRKKTAMPSRSRTQVDLLKTRPSNVKMDSKHRSRTQVDLLKTRPANVKSDSKKAGSPRRRRRSIDLTSRLSERRKQKESPPLKKKRPRSKSMSEPDLFTEPSSSATRNTSQTKNSGNGSGKKKRRSHSTTDLFKSANTNRKKDISPVKSKKKDISPVKSKKKDMSPVKSKKKDISPVKSKKDISPVKSKKDTSPGKRKLKNASEKNSSANIPLKKTRSSPPPKTSSSKRAKLELETNKKTQTKRSPTRRKSKGQSSPENNVKQKKLKSAKSCATEIEKKRSPAARKLMKKKHSSMPNLLQTNPKKASSSSRAINEKNRSKAMRERTSITVKSKKKSPSQRTKSVLKKEAKEMYNTPNKKQKNSRQKSMTNPEIPPASTVTIKKEKRTQEIDLFNHDMFVIPDCSEIPYVDHHLHDDIIKDHFKFRKSIINFYIQNSNNFIQTLKTREAEILSLMKENEDGVGKNSTLLKTLEDEYHSKKHLVEEYEKAIEEFEMCKECLNALDERQYAFLKAMKRPPAVFHHIIAGVLLVLGYNETDWDKCRKFLLIPQSRREMLDFDPTNINMGDILQFAAWMEQHPESFTFKRAERVSPVASLLCKWLLSLINICEQVKRFHELRGEKHSTLEEINKLKARIIRVRKGIESMKNKKKEWQQLLMQLRKNQKQLHNVISRSEKRLENLQISKPVLCSPDMGTQI